MSIIYHSAVQRGDQSGRTIGFPTVNLDPSVIPVDTVPGVYSSVVKYDETEYKGALYYGPRKVKNETTNVLEIYILEFNKEIYDETVFFTLDTFIRGVMDFTSFDEMKAQLQKDIEAVRSKGTGSPVM